MTPAQNVKALELELNALFDHRPYTVGKISDAKKSIAKNTQSALDACQLTISPSENIAILTAAVESTRPSNDEIAARIRQEYEKEMPYRDHVVDTVRKIVANLDLIEEIDDASREDLKWMTIYHRFEYYDPITIEHLREGERDQLKMWEESRVELIKAMEGFQPDLIMQEELLVKIDSIMQNQTEEVRNEILQRTPAHLLLDYTLKRPELNFDKNQSFNVLLPLELAGMVFESCDLDACVNLRQVCKSWWDAFHQHETVLKEKVIESNPWIEPGYEMETWGDCALVVAGRLNSGWTAIDSVDDVELDGPASKTNVIVAAAVEGALNKDFRLLSHAQKVDLQCHDLKLDVFGLEASVPEKSLPESILVDSDKIEVSFSDKSLPTVTLPGLESFGLTENTLRSRLSVSVSKDYIISTISEVVYILPRDFPDFRQGHGIKYSAERMSSYALQGAVCARLGNFEPDRKAQYLMSDKHSKTMVPLYEGDISSGPISVYNGLIWVGKMSPSGTISLVPISFHHGKKYYRKDRVINGISTRLYLKSVSSRYVLTSKSDIVDLATGVVTLVKGEGESFTGFKNGQFNAWRYTTETIDRYKKEVKRRWRRNPNQKKYDLSTALEGDEEEDEWSSEEEENPYVPYGTWWR